MHSYSEVAAAADDDDDSRMTMKRHDQIYNLLTMTMGFANGEKSNGHELLRRMSGE